MYANNYEKNNWAACISIGGGSFGPTPTPSLLQRRGALYCLHGIFGKLPLQLMRSTTVLNNSVKELHVYLILRKLKPVNDAILFKCYVTTELMPTCSFVKFKKTK